MMKAATVCEGGCNCMCWQVRKMTKHAGHTTLRLVRAGVGRLQLEDLGLRPGEWRPIARSDVL